jgi:gliding motility-associated-like protein
VKRFNTPGVYNVQLTVKNAVGCTSDPFILPVTVHLQPVIDAGNSFVVPQGTVVQLTATSNAASGVTYNWTPPLGVSDPAILNPTVTANSDQTYTLTATGAFGCTATDFITVKILKPVTVPNIFTPNGDGIHDTWLIPNLADYPGCTVEVFNRYGQKVFHSAGYGTPWNGTFKGKDMPLGTYYYIIQLQNGFKPMTGSITIVR